MIEISLIKKGFFYSNPCKHRITPWPSRLAARAASIIGDLERRLVVVGVSGRRGPLLVCLPEFSETKMTRSRVFVRLQIVDVPILSADRFESFMHARTAIQISIGTHMSISSR